MNSNRFLDHKHQSSAPADIEAEIQSLVILVETLEKRATEVAAAVAELKERLLSTPPDLPPEGAELLADLIACHANVVRLAAAWRDYLSR